MRLGHKDDGVRLIQEANETEVKQLESPQSSQMTRLSELTKMLDDELITREEFLKLKKDII
jgi:hypothetical protein